MIEWTFFPDNGGQAMGVNDAGIQTFKGDLELSLAREILQNSVDAHDSAASPNKPVRVVIERFEKKRAEIPGIDELVETYKRCAEFWSGDPKAVEIFGRARDVASRRTIPILRVGDYNTTGVIGGDQDKDSNWYKLVRSSGSSSKAGGEGGSYGIGKNAPFAASALQVVFYCTCTGRNRHAFQGVARLVTHERPKLGTVQPTAYLGDRNGASVRSKAALPKGIARSERGTDVYVIGYQGDSDWAGEMTRDVLSSFWPAIHYGHLEVEVGSTKITGATLPPLMQKHSTDEDFTAHLYYKAFVDNAAVVTTRTLPILGEVTLRLLEGEDLPKHVAMVRKSGMVIKLQRFNSPVPYCGVFECKNDKGNMKLRSMEPPRHNEWDANHPEKGANKQTAAEIRDFIRECVAQLAPATTAEVLDVPDLAALLPDDDDVKDEKFGGDGEESDGDGQSFDRRPPVRQMDTRRIRSLRVGVDKAGRDGDDEVGGGGHGNGDENGGDDGDGEGEDEKKGGGAGERVRLEPPLRFRVFPRDLKRGIYSVVLSSHERRRRKARLLLNAVGDDASRAPIAVDSARMSNGKKVRVRKGTEIGPLEFRQNGQLRLDVVLKFPQRLAIEVEAYEA